MIKCVVIVCEPANYLIEKDKFLKAQTAGEIIDEVKTIQFLPVTTSGIQSIKPTVQPMIVAAIYYEIKQMLN